MQLSKRMQAVANLITPGDSLADVGTDHGYIPIYAVEEKIVERAIAMDINRGPIERAASHIAEHGLEAYIETRCCDGVADLKAGEVQTVVIAGMGGGLMQKILEEGCEVLATVSEVILQPQSEIEKFRYYLAENGWYIEKKDMVFEDGKYYPMMRAVHGNMEISDVLFGKFGIYLLKDQNPVLKDYLNKSLETNQMILQQLYDNGRTEDDVRVKEIKEEMQYMETALKYYEM